MFQVNKTCKGNIVKHYMVQERNRLGLLWPLQREWYELHQWQQLCSHLHPTIQGHQKPKWLAKKHFTLYLRGWHLCLAQEGAKISHHAWCAEHQQLVYQSLHILDWESWPVEKFKDGWLNYFLPFIREKYSSMLMVQVKVLRVTASFKIC